MSNVLCPNQRQQYIIILLPLVLINSCDRLRFAKLTIPTALSFHDILNQAFLTVVGCKNRYFLRLVSS